MTPSVNHSFNKKNYDLLSSFLAHSPRSLYLSLPCRNSQLNSGWGHRGIMEAAGLALGTIALISIFKDCIDVFSLICMARQAGRDFDILNTKLDIEKTLLLQWAHRVRLLNPIYDERLAEVATREAVAKILQQMHTLLRDATSLQNRYGLETSSRETSSSLIPSDTISRRRFDDFDKAFRDLSKRVKNLRVSPVNQVRWVVKDKESFADLIGDISYFVTKLDSLVPGTVCDTQRLVLEDFSPEMRADKLALVCDVEQSREDVIKAAKNSLALKCQERILRLLWYPEMTSREENITPAHEATLIWALQPQPEGGD